MALKFYFVIFLIYFFVTTNSKSVKSYADIKCKKQILSLVNAVCCGYWDSLVLDRKYDGPNDDLEIPEEQIKPQNEKNIDDLCYCAVCFNSVTKYETNLRSLAKNKFIKQSKLNSKHTEVDDTNRRDESSDEPVLSRYESDVIHSRQKRGYNLQYVNVQYIPSGGFGSKYYGASRRRDLFNVPYYGRSSYGRFY